MVQHTNATTFPAYLFALVIINYFMPTCLNSTSAMSSTEHLLQDLPCPCFAPCLSTCIPTVTHEITGIRHDVKAFVSWHQRQRSGSNHGKLGLPGHLHRGTTPRQVCKQAYVSDWHGKVFWLPLYWACSQNCKSALRVHTLCAVQKWLPLAKQMLTMHCIKLLVFFVSILQTCNNDFWCNSTMSCRKAIRCFDVSNKYLSIGLLWS